MATIGDLQSWYAAHCDGEWEHARGLKISTLDNPGWSVEVDLAGTSLDGQQFQPVHRGDSEVDASWLSCRVEGSRFRGFGGAHDLEEILDTFFRWAST